ncbi:MAG: GntR family transcriptional regulator [Rubrivivax sp.]|nr:GntR family transcriptional regulator [Rubrivivax sp.]
MTVDPSNTAFLGASPLPRHALVARALLEQIGAERYRVGELLPTEADLCRQFGVSRTTLREAVRWLRTHGMVSARAGVGTRVLAREPNVRYVHAINSIADVFQYAKDSRAPVVLASEEFDTGPRDAEFLRCPPGQRWLRIELTRAFRGDDTPILHAVAWVPQAYQGIARLVPLRSSPIYKLLESEYQEPVLGVDQEFKATRLNARIGRLLGAARAGAPALCVVRHYYGRGERLLLVTQSHYRADRYSYRIGLRFDASGTEAATRG